MAAEQEQLFDASEEDIVYDLFRYWRVALQRQKSRFSVKRARLIKARLAEGFTVEDIKLAIDACAKSTWHTDRGHTDLTLICRSPEHLEGFIEREKATVRRAARSYRRDDGSPYDRQVRRTTR